MTKVVFGAGGHAKVVIDIARTLCITITMVIDDSPRTSALEGIPVIESAESFLLKTSPFEFIVAIGNNVIRAKTYARMTQFGTSLNLIHPFTSISSQARICRGVAIMPGVVINTGAEIGDNCIINTSASVDHDCVIHPHVHLCPGVRLAGNVTIGAGSMLGTGTSVIPGISIGKNCLIGAGSVVVRDIPDHSVAFGNPARVLRANSPAFI